MSSTRNNGPVKNIWIRLLSNYTTSTKLITKLWDEINTNYSSNARKYHNLNHIKYMIDKAIVHQSKIGDYNILLFSIFYHDIVYDVSSNVNEAKSAVKARNCLAEIGIPNYGIDKCEYQILATKKHEEVSDNDVKFLLDFDLAILGETGELYEIYANNIRREYSIYSHETYNNGRRNVLEHFLKKKRIYKTNEFYDLYERQARVNLKQELTKLG